MLFLVLVTSTKHYWVISAERRRCWCRLHEKRSKFPLLNCPEVVPKYSSKRSHDSNPRTLRLTAEECKIKMPCLVSLPGEMTNFNPSVGLLGLPTPLDARYQACSLIRSGRRFDAVPQAVMAARDRNAASLRNSTFRRPPIRGKPQSTLAPNRKSALVGQAIARRWHVRTRSSLRVHPA